MSRKQLSSDEVFVRCLQTGYLPKKLSHKELNRYIHALYKKATELQNIWDAIVFLNYYYNTGKDIYPFYLKKRDLKFFNNIRDEFKKYYLEFKFKKNDIKILKNEFEFIDKELKNVKMMLFNAIKPLVWGVMQKRFYGWKNYYDEFYIDIYIELLQEIKKQTYREDKAPFISFLHRIIYITCLRNTAYIQKHYLVSIEDALKERDVYNVDEENIEESELYLIPFGEFDV